MESGQAIPAVAGHVLASAVPGFRFRSDPLGPEGPGSAWERSYLYPLSGRPIRTHDDKASVHNITRGNRVWN